MTEVVNLVSAEGTVTIPEDLRVRLGLQPGSRVAFDWTRTAISSSGRSIRTSPLASPAFVGTRARG